MTQETKNLPKNWGNLAEEISREFVWEEFIGREDGIYDISCPIGTEGGTMLIIKDGKYYRLTEKSFAEAIVH
jgi:hypothetical protein